VAHFTVSRSTAQAHKALSSYDSSDQSYRLGAFAGPAGRAGGAVQPLAEQDAEKRRLEVRRSNTIPYLALVTQYALAVTLILF
jgi:hypothetical protein